MNWTIVMDQNKIKKILKDEIEWNENDSVISLVQKDGRVELIIYKEDDGTSFWMPIAESTPQDSVSFIHDIEDYLPHPLYRTIACGYVVP